MKFVTPSLSFKVSFVVGLVAALPAMAHVEVGTYVGNTPEGEPCSFQAQATYFENNERHPLNERVPVEFEGQAFLLQHPPVIGVAESKVSFNHDLFHAVVPTSEGAKALVVDMVHSETWDGPTSFQVITHAWAKNERSKLECNNLKLQP